MTKAQIKKEFVLNDEQMSEVEKFRRFLKGGISFLDPQPAAFVRGL